MAETLDLKSYEEILEEMLRSVQSRAGLSDANIGAITLSLLEAAAQSDFFQIANILAALDSISVDRAEGTALDNIAFQEGLTRVGQSKASGAVTVTDSSFNKISTQIYANTPPPIAGATIIYVNNASEFTSTGSIYVGRGTSQIEGPIRYSSITQVGSYFKLTLSTSLAKSHNNGESIVLAQGGLRSIPAGTTVVTPASGAAPSISFQTTALATIADGETEVSGVPVLCTQAGTVGNAPAGTLTIFSGSPFPNATVSNSSPFSNATDVETDFDLRQRIKFTRQSRSKGTSVAIENALINQIAPDEQKRISSVSVEESADKSLPSIVRIDDGTAYEPIYGGVSQETIIESAIGGEDTLQLTNTPVVKAQVTTINTSPYAIYDDYKLSVLVGGELSEHAFQVSDFRTEGAATAYEIVASINANSDLLFSARTASGGNKVTLFAKAESNENIEVTTPDSGFDANTLLNFPQLDQFTLYLYKNDELLTKDGTLAELESEAFPWNTSLASYGLTVAIDGTPNTTYTFSSTELSPYSPSNAPLETWAEAVNAKIPGITAITRNNLLVISSNKGATDKASVVIDSSCSMVTPGAIFSTNLAITGSSSDYSLIRSSGQIKLAEPAVAGDNFVTGTQYFQAHVQTDPISGGSFNLSTTANLWLIVDSEAEEIATVPNLGSNISVTNVSGTLWRFVGAAGSFSNVAIGDWIISWDSALSSNNKGYWRVVDSSGTTVDVRRSSGTSETVTLTDTDSIRVVRSSGIVQQVIVPSGSYSLDTAINTLNAILVGATATVIGADIIKISTNTYESTGKLCLVASDNGAKSIGFSGDVTLKSNSVPHVAAIESGNSEIGVPEFSQAMLSANASTSNTLFISSTSVSIDPDKLLAYVKVPTGSNYGNNRYASSAINHVVSSTTSIPLTAAETVQNIISSDRAYVCDTFDFSASDKLNVVVDNNPASETIVIPLYRTVSLDSSPSPTVNSFNATDVDGGNSNLTNTFGPAFSFANYKAWSRARAIADPSGSNNAMVVRAVPFGPNGNHYKFGFEYPALPSQSMTGTTSVNTSETKIDNIFYLASDPARNNSISGTQFVVTVVGSSPYQVRYAYGGGTAPDFVNNGVQAGDIINISSTSGFSAANYGTFRITAVSATSITISNWAINGIPSGESVTVSVGTNMVIFPLSATNTANNIIPVVNDILGDNISVTLANGETGSGTILTSTIDDNSGSYINLADGENWLKTASLTSSPQFTLENNLSLSTNSLYSLVNEQFRFIPHTAKQVSEFMSSDAISAINSLAALKATSGGGKIQINSDEFGTDGSIQVAGGTANSAGGSIVGTANLSNTNTLLIRSTSGADSGLNEGSWLKITSALPFKKSLNINATTGFSIIDSLNLSISSGTGSFLQTISHSADNTTNIQVDLVNNFVAFKVVAGTAANFSMTVGDWVTISSTSSFNVHNQGTYRVVAKLTDGFWIENSSAVNESVTLSSSADLTFYTQNSILPGDTLVLSGGVLDSANDGTYTVAESSALSITVSTSAVFSTTVSMVVPASSVGNIASFDQNVSNIYKQVITTQPVSSLGESLCDILLTPGSTFLDSQISDSYESTFECLNKLDFSTNIVYGIDSYLAYQGLIKEANRIIFNDPRDTTAYPGIKAAGAFLDIQPPLPRKVSVSLGVRLKTNVRLSVIQNNIKSVVAGIINNTDIGESIAINEIVDAVGAIDGIFAVSVIYPTYDSNNDLIIINNNEKPICDASTDVSVTLLSN